MHTETVTTTFRGQRCRVTVEIEAYDPDLTRAVCRGLAEYEATLTHPWSVPTKQEHDPFRLLDSIDAEPKPEPELTPAHEATIEKRPKGWQRGTRNANYAALDVIGGVEAVAARHGVHKQTVYKALRGERCNYPDLLAELTAALGEEWWIHTGKEGEA